MVKSSCCDSKKGARIEEGDPKLLSFISKNGKGNWVSASRKTESSSGLKRCGKSCRLRWTNYLRSDLKHESFSPEEEELIIKLHAAIGSRWPTIATQLPGRSDNDIKNLWNTKLKKKLTDMGIDPVTHKPFSQILADYGNIGALARVTNAPNKHNTISAAGGSTRIRDFKKHTFSPFNPPKTDPNTALNTHSTNPSHSLDLLSQLQAITLVTEGPKACSYGVFTQMPSPNYNSSSASACSSSTYTAAVAQSPDQSSFSWHDFLLDPPAPNQVQEQQDNGSGFSSNEPFDVPKIGGNNHDGDAMKGRRQEVQGGSSSLTSSSEGSLFLEAMLDQENDMFLNFPGLMDEPLY